MSNPREIAVLTLHQIIYPDTPKINISDSEQGVAFIKMLNQTSLRNYVSSLKIINQFIQRKIPKKHLIAQTILICAISEMLFMDSPAYAIINSYVEIAKKHCGKHMGGFVNAILRKINQNYASIQQSYQQRFFPKSFLQIIEKDYNKETITRIEKASLQEPPLNITVKNSVQNWAEKLSGTYIDANSICLSSTGKIENISGYKEGAWWVQDISASLAANCFSDIKGRRILDLCAAPGGKTAQLINMGARVTSLDCSKERLQTLQQNLQRLQLECEKIICCDVIEYLQNFSEEPFDGILLDAPCSATGIFRRHPEIVHIKTINDVKKQANLQKNILERISPALKSGGELIYCTCSIAKAEGETQILDFIANHKFRIEPLSSQIEPQSITNDGFIRTLPYHYKQYGGCDAFFIAKLIKE